MTRTLCALRHLAPQPLPPGLPEMRMKAIVLNKDKWLNGTTLRFFFKTVGAHAWPEAQKDVVRRAFDHWKAQDIGLTFAETASERDATLIIGFVDIDPSDPELAEGSWSYVGTQVLKARRNGCNMNFGWDLTPDWGWGTALHEIGHALGMPHEHQNPKAGIQWDEDRVLEVYSNPPNNWKEDTIRWNIIRKLSRADITGSDWDPLSIMHYPIDPGLMTAPQPYDTEGTPENTALSTLDVVWVRRFYPPLDQAKAIGIGVLEPLAAASGAQTDFIFIPDESRDYRIQAVGEADVKLALFDVTDGEPQRTVAADDDSGVAANAAISSALKAGRKYRIGARTHYAAAPGGANLVVL